MRVCQPRNLKWGDTHKYPYFYGARVARSWREIVNLNFSVTLLPQWAPWGRRGLQSLCRFQHGLSWILIVAWGEFLSWAAACVLQSVEIGSWAWGKLRF